MQDVNFLRMLSRVLAALVMCAARPPSTNAANMVLSDNVKGVSSGGTEAATGSTWLASSFSTDTSTYQLNSVTLLLENPVSGAAVVDIYSDGGLEPGSLVGALTSPSSYVGPLVETTFTASDITLSANSTYWVVLEAPQGEFDWSWASSDSGTGVGFTDTWSSSSDGGNSWFTYVGPDSYPLQMIVNASAVPEPATLTLLATGAGLLLLRQRYRGRLEANLRPSKRPSSAEPVIPSK
jgi:hypothetical protein